MAIKQEWRDALVEACTRARAGERNVEAWSEEGAIAISINGGMGVVVALFRDDKSLCDELMAYCEDLSATRIVVAFPERFTRSGAVWEICFRPEGVN
jgi:hypothetical protein